MSKPVFGLKAEWRPYKCSCCGHEKEVSTNHTDVCFDYCESCSWKVNAYPGMDFGGHKYRAFAYNGE